ncbi:ABC transporter ATP-binding protein [Sulfitobacter sp. PR48]|jgi:branched-chain amino acid transport system ATP-binding protein|uniref:ABC transporter ATP-binding protein n=1 Tax=Sulfitobacter sp. PR48 TaxID=3028383 RepID=UPI00237BFCA0|nr:ABC transporter ATP-binding protein [Sulfitobacter sp. PR48]MDD9721828.1 ABC transporter ATP-binding protein [Sulfitobacter sp. PR48]
MILLETKGLTRVYGGLTAVDGVDFALPKGEVHALIGPNGAGKSTFVGMISGRIPASSGEVWFDGQNVTPLPAHARIRRGMAYTFQITAVYARLSLADNLALALRSRDRGAALAALDRVGLADRADQMTGDLAYGHQRLLEIAMGVAQKPRLLILDEPTQGLAESEIEGFNALIRELAGETTILLIEHNMNVVMALADRITVLDMGRILASGTPAEIHANRAVQDAYLGTG